MSKVFKKHTYTILIIFLILSILTGCSNSNSDSEDKYNLTIDIIGSGEVKSGDINFEPDNPVKYKENSIITLETIANQDWYFKDWGGNDENDVIPEGDKWKIKIDEDKNITAIFSEDSTADLSDGKGNIILENFDSNDYALALIYSRDNGGQTSWNIGEFKTGNSDNTTEKNINKSESKSKLPLGGSQNKYIKELELETRKNHSTLNKTMPLYLSATEELSLGDEKEFNVYQGSESAGFKNVTAMLKAKGKESLIWIDNSIKVTEDDISKMKDRFENKIYSTVTSNFGEEPNANNFSALANKDDRINILVTPLKDENNNTWAGGYFWSIDLYSQKDYPNSNERKIFYIHHYDWDALDYQIGTIAHEFQHMIFYNEKIINEKPLYGTRSDSWINEGFSQLAEDMSGYGYRNGTDSDLSAYLDNPGDTSLLYWGQTTADYNISYLFARYIYDRFGKGIIDYVHEFDESYKEAISSYTGLSFERLYEDWSLALVFDSNDEIIESKYNFSSIDISRPAVTVLEEGQVWKDKTVKGWSNIYTVIEKGNGNDLNIEVNNAAVDGEMKMKIYERSVK